MDEVDQVKSKINIVEIIQEFVPLKKAGKNWKGLCPFHGEKTPSFMVSEELQIYKCFGCSAGGDVFDFLERIEGMEFGEALRMLAKRAGVELKGPVSDTPQGRQKDRLYQVNYLAQEFYHYMLTKHPLGKKALVYISERGITPETIATFKLGFSPNMWDGLQQFMAVKKRAVIDELERAGLVIRRPQRTDESDYDRFRGRLMFPIRDHRGNVIGFSGRIIPGVTEGETDAPKYLNTPETAVFHKGELLFGLDITRPMIKKADEAVLVEGQMDVVGSYQAGVENVVGVGGTALTEMQLRLLKRFTAELRVGLDADFAGDAAARRGLQLADGLGFVLRVIRLKAGKDPDECARHDPQSWRQSVDEAVPVYDFYIQSAVSRYGLDTPDGKRKIGRELVPIWSKISDPILRAAYTKQLAKTLDIDEDVIVREIQRVGSVSPVASKSAVDKVPAQERVRKDIMEEYLLALGFQREPKRLLEDRVLSLVSTPAAKAILKVLGTHPEAAPAEIQQLLPAELQGIFGKIMLADLQDTLSESQKWEKEFRVILDELDRLKLREEMGQKTKQIGELERGGDEGGLGQAEADLSRLLLKLHQLETPA